MIRSILRWLFPRPAPVIRCTDDNVNPLLGRDANWSLCNWPDCGCPDGAVKHGCAALRNAPETVRKTWINDNAPDQMKREGDTP